LRFFILIHNGVTRGAVFSPAARQHVARRGLYDRLNVIMGMIVFPDWRVKHGQAGPYTGLACYELKTLPDSNVPERLG
jgi:hypothetical protein